MDDKKNQAVHDFVDREFKGIPTSMIEVYLQANEEGIEDITPLKVGDTYHLYDTEEEVEVLSYDPSSDMYTVQLEDGSEKEIERFEVSENNYMGRELPMWGTMWLCEKGYWSHHINELANAGFTVFDLKDENQLLVGIDGAGYSFFESHWEPLYDSMGYKWHLHDENMVAMEKAIDLAVSLGGKPDKIAKALDLPKDTVKQYISQSVR